MGVTDGKKYKNIINFIEIYIFIFYYFFNIYEKLFKEKI